MIVLDGVSLPSPTGRGVSVVDASEQFLAGTVSVIIGGSRLEPLVLGSVIGMPRPLSGRILVAGLDLVEATQQVRQRVTCVPIQAPVLGHLTTNEHVRYLVDLSGHKVSSRQLLTALRWCGVPDRLMKLRTSELQPIHRLGLWLAACRLRESSVLLMFDPTVDLNRAQVRFASELVREMATHQRCVLLTSRDESFAESVADVRYRIDQGHLISTPIDRSVPPGLLTSY